MDFNFSRVFRTKRGEGKPQNALTRLDKPKPFVGYATILKGPKPKPKAATAVQAFKGNNAFSTRMANTKFW